MNSTGNLYTNRDWIDYAEYIKKRDGYKCLRCGRGGPGVVLQVHHTIYKRNLQLWEYPSSDCITLCKGCHARQHGLVEPDSEWTLISIEDLGYPSGICERKGCGHEIRYEHMTYHPSWGYKVVGSTCIQHLTRSDQFTSQDVVNTLKKISNFLSKHKWDKRVTLNGFSFIFTKFNHHEIRIYGSKGSYSYQLGIKETGRKKLNFFKSVRLPNTNLDQVKEIAFIVLKGKTSLDEDEKDILREILKNAMDRIKRT